jgi:cellulose synthase/poly-beta-1,6-N-acetylglucosamine synthase-like glycosyltransferase
MLTTLFWILSGAIVYTYFGYPLVLHFAAKVYKKEIKKKDIYPSVSLIIAAYNEEKSIEDKIKNSLDLDYPQEKLEIIVASDCSTDKTNEIVKQFSSYNVKLSVSKERRGKTAGRNMVVPVAKGEIIILSDATGIYERDVIKKLVRNFYDDRVGCVGGILKYVNHTNSMVGSGEGLYWRYEMSLRRKESLLGNLTSVSGSIYAFRKNLFMNIPEDLADDLVVPLTIKKLGYYTILEPEAICAEETTKNEKEESNKRARIANRNIMGLLYMKELLNFFKYRLFSLELFSHKVMRLLMPLFLISFFIINFTILNISFFYTFFAFMQVIFYVIAFIGYIFQKKFKKRSRIFYVPLFFCVSNLAIFLGIIKFLAGHRKAVWEPAR